MGLLVLRVIFVIVSSALGVSLIRSGLLPSDSATMTWAALGGMLGLALCVIGVDMLFRRKDLATISAVYFGLVVGLFLAYVVGLALSTVLPENAVIRGFVNTTLAAVVSYICISLLMQTQHDFRFVIPYVEFAKETKGRRPYVLDTSVVIDGRIADVIDAHLFDGQLIMPRFAIGELQAIADSSDRLRRSRGRRGLDILNRLRNNPDVDLQIFDRDLPEFAGQPVDQKLVGLTKHLNGKLVTNDFNLNKVAKLNGVGVINLNDLANALKPIFLPGEQIEVRVVKLGEEVGQGVGYLEDGTMVVIEGGRDYVNRQVKIAVTSVLQTSAGRMVFGRFEGLAQENGA